MAFFSKNIDMLNGTIWDKMVVFAIPLALRRTSAALQPCRRCRSRTFCI